MSIDNRYNITNRTTDLVNNGHLEESEQARLLQALGNGRLERNFLDSILDRYEEGTSQDQATIGYQLENLLPFAESRVFSPQELERIFNNGGIASLNNSLDYPGDLTNVISYEDGHNSFTSDEWERVNAEVFATNRYKRTNLGEQVFFYSSQDLTEEEGVILSQLKDNLILQNLFELIRGEDQANELRIMTGNILASGSLGLNVVWDNEGLVTLDLSKHDLLVTLLNEISEAYAGFLDDSDFRLSSKRTFQTLSVSIDVLFQSANLTAERLNEVNSQYIQLYSDYPEFSSRQDAEAGIELLLRSKPYFDAEAAGIEFTPVRVSDTEWTIQARQSKPPEQEPVITQPPKPEVQQTDEAPPTQSDEPYLPPIENVVVQTNPTEEPIRNLTVNVPRYGDFDVQVIKANIPSSRQNELMDAIIQFFNAPENLKPFLTPEELKLMRQGNVIDMGNNPNLQITNEVQISFGGIPLNLRITRTRLDYEG
jgi:hypothetical protein